MESYLVQFSVSHKMPFFEDPLDNFLPCCLRSQRISGAFQQEIKMVGRRLSFSDNLQELKF